MRQTPEQEISESSSTWFKGVCNRELVAPDAMMYGLDGFTWILRSVGNHVLLDARALKKESYKNLEDVFGLDANTYISFLLRIIESTIQQSLVETIKYMAVRKEIPVSEKRLFCSLVLFDRKSVSEWQIVFLISKDQEEHDSVLRALDNPGLESITYIARFMDADYTPKLVREDSYIEIVNHQDLYMAKCCDSKTYTLRDFCKFITLESKIVNFAKRMVKEAGRTDD